jgi:hypothetical protein
MNRYNRQRPDSPKAAGRESPRDRPPRLGVIHYLMWMTAAAMLFKITLITAPPGDRGHSLSQNVSFPAIRAMYGITYAAGIVGVSVLLSWSIRGRTSPLRPGHWLLLGEVPADMLVLVLQAGLMAECSDLASYRCLLILLPLYVTPSVCRVVLYGRQCLCTRDGMTWRVLFASLAILAAVSAFLWILLAVGSSPSYPSYFRRIWVATVLMRSIVCLALLATAFGQFRHGSDWLHWLGVGIFASIVGGLLVSQVKGGPFLAGS